MVTGTLRVKKNILMIIIVISDVVASYSNFPAFSYFTADSHLQVFFLTIISRSYLFFSEKSSQKFSFFGNSVKSLAAAKSISNLHALKTKKIKSVKLLKSDFICFAYKIPDKYWKNQLPYYFQLTSAIFFPGTCVADISVWSALHIVGVGVTLLSFTSKFFML